MSGASVSHSDASLPESEDGTGRCDSENPTPLERADSDDSRPDVLHEDDHSNQDDNPDVLKLQARMANLLRSLEKDGIDSAHAKPIEAPSVAPETPLTTIPEVMLQASSAIVQLRKGLAIHVDIGVEIMASTGEVHRELGPAGTFYQLLPTKDQTTVGALYLQGNMRPDRPEHATHPTPIYGHTACAARRLRIHSHEAEARGNYRPHGIHAPSFRRVSSTACPPGYEVHYPVHICAGRHDEVADSFRMRRL